MYPYEVINILGLAWEKGHNFSPVKKWALSRKTSLVKGANFIFGSWKSAKILQLWNKKLNYELNNKN